MKLARFSRLLVSIALTVAAVQAAPFSTGYFPAPYTANVGDDLVGQAGWTCNDPANDLTFFVRWNGRRAVGIGGYMATPSLLHPELAHLVSEPLAGAALSVDLAFVDSTECQPGQVPGVDCYPGHDAFGWVLRETGGSLLMRFGFEPTPAHRLEMVWYDAAGTRTSSGYDLAYGSTYSMRVSFAATGADLAFAATMASGSAVTFSSVLPGKANAVLHSVGPDVRIAGLTPTESGDNFMIFNRLTVLSEIGLVSPSAQNFVIAEVNYHPSSPTASELAAGFSNSEDFEFVRLQNVGAAPLDLRLLRFRTPFFFDFSGGLLPMLPPGANILVVKRRAAFEQRYSTAYSGTISGEVSNFLNNAGQTLVLEVGSAAAGTNPILLAVSYDNDPPWPAAADGLGATLVLRNPTASPNAADPAAWAASAQAGGLPGGLPQTMTFERWRNLCFSAADAANPAIAGLLADPDADGATNLLEYALGACPRLADAVAHFPATSVTNVAGESYQTLECRLQANASDVVVAPEVSSDLAAWSGGAQLPVVVGPAPQTDGSVLWKWRDSQPLAGAQRRFLRVSVSRQ